MWFAIFARDENHVYPERTSGILGTLAMVHRQRGEVAPAWEIMELYERVLARYVDMSTRIPGSDVYHCAKSLTFKKNQIKMNIYLMHGDYSTKFGRLRIPDPVAAGPVFKELLRYEIEEELDFEEAIYCAMIHYSFGKGYRGYLYTMDDFNALTDRHFVKMMRDVS